MKRPLKVPERPRAVIGTTRWFEQRLERAVVVQRGRRRRIEYQPLDLLPATPGWVTWAWFEARVVLRATLLLTTGLWFRRVFEQLLDTKLFNESIVNREWDHVIRDVEIDVTYADGKGAA